MYSQSFASGLWQDIFFVCLNTPIVRSQIRSKQFTQDIIDTLGARVRELILPMPKNKRIQRAISSQAKEIIEERAKYRDQARQLDVSPGLLDDE